MPACPPECFMPLIATLVSRPAERALSLSLANMASR
ncbi:phosphoserine phosphatase SerB, partial [Mesorhizobium sp. M7A.F.Ca.CA.001.10.2.1]